MKLPFWLISNPIPEAMRFSRAACLGLKNESNQLFTQTPSAPTAIKKGANA
ncbi:hypothetical protein BH10PSE16_BH10PSE16_42900 [soil metagenome]